MTALSRALRVARETCSFIAFLLLSCCDLVRDLRVLGCIPGRLYAWRKLRDSLLLTPCESLSSPTTAENDGAEATPVCIITGGNAGIGRRTAYHLLCCCQWRVILACRTQGKGDAACRELLTERDAHRAAKGLPPAPKGATAECWQCDVSDFESVRRFAQRVRDSGRPVKVLILNAGIMATPPQLTRDGFESQVASNHLGHYLLVRLLEPVLQRSAPSRVVFVSSSTHLRAAAPPDRIFQKYRSAEELEADYNRYGLYYQTKLCNVISAIDLHRQWVERGLYPDVTVTALHPGCIGTGVMGELPLGFLLKPPGKLVMRTVDEGATYVLNAAVSPALKGVSGKYLSLFEVARPNPMALDRELQERVIRLSEAAVAPFLE